MLKIPISKLWNKINLIFVLIFTILFGVVFFVSNLNYFFAQNISAMTTKKFDKSLVMLDKNIKFESQKQYIMQNYDVQWEREITTITLLDDELFDFLADKKTNGLDFLGNKKWWLYDKQDYSVVSNERNIYDIESSSTIAMSQSKYLTLNKQSVNFVGNFKLYLRNLSTRDKKQSPEMNPSKENIDAGKVVFRLSDKNKILPPNAILKEDFIIHQFETEDLLDKAFYKSPQKSYTLISTANQWINEFYEAQLYAELENVLTTLLVVFGFAGVFVFTKSWAAQTKYRFLYIATGADNGQLWQIYAVFYGLLLFPSIFLGAMFAKIGLQLSLGFWTTNIFDQALAMGNNYNFEAVSFFALNLILPISWFLMVTLITLIYVKFNNK